MSESDIATRGITVLPDTIPGSVIEEAAGRIDDEEVDSHLHGKISGRPRDRVFLEKNNQYDEFYDVGQDWY
ncbi:hypothetical protein GP486_004061 [Trichoglossum hirsutum]|uniref:Uncharacterized protein n=1 Tax=Trichoglossum hirsutum TaxID=265104 RepID=A0A9P8LC43_9PEZI|nr:hypothetical protein GP486_004061 [Trichoglossum hirsutum]